MDVLTILANVAIRNKKCNLEVRTALSGISEWFDEYMNAEENDSSKVRIMLSLNFNCSHLYTISMSLVIFRNLSYIRPWSCCWLDAGNIPLRQKMCWNLLWLVDIYSLFNIVEF